MTGTDKPPASQAASAQVPEPGSDRRRSARFPISTIPTVASRLDAEWTGAPIPATIQDISSGGLLVHLRNSTPAPPVRVGDRLGLSVEQPAQSPAESVSVMPVDVVRVQHVRRGPRTYWAVGCLFPPLEERAAAEQQERLRLEGVLLLARTAEHLLNNQLSLTVGYAEMLARDPRLPEDARALAYEALQGATEAARMVQQFPRIRSLPVDKGPQWVQGSILDLARAVQETTQQASAS